MTRFEYNFLFRLPWWLKQGLCMCQLPCSGLLEKKYKRHYMLSKNYSKLHLSLRPIFRLYSFDHTFILWPLNLSCTCSFYSTDLASVVWENALTSIALQAQVGMTHKWTFFPHKLTHSRLPLLKMRRESQIFSQVPWWRCSDYCAHAQKLCASIDWDIMICIDWEVRKLSCWIFSTGCVKQ